MNQAPPENKPAVVFQSEEDRWFIYYEDTAYLLTGHPSRPDSIKINATATVKIGVLVASKDYEGIEGRKMFT